METTDLRSFSPARRNCFFFSSRRRHTRSLRDWSSDVCSSDLAVRRGVGALHFECGTACFDLEERREFGRHHHGRDLLVHLDDAHPEQILDEWEDRPRMRSEEHTSELQSRRDLVCRLLLEKKKTNQKSDQPV